MTTILLIIWSVIQFCVDYPHDIKVVEWKVKEDSQLEIKGTTNINKFQCAAMDYSGKNRMTEYQDPDSGEAYWNGEIVVLTRNFDCFNPMITSDFRKTLMEKDHPKIKIKFLRLYKRNMDNTLTGTAEITLAGISRKFFIDCRMSTAQGGIRELKGHQSFLFSDFGMVPPEKFFGAIKVNDIIFVEFLIYLSQVGT